MGNAFSIDKHPKRKAIEKDILSGSSYNSIAVKYGISSTSCVERYAKKRLPQLLAKSELQEAEGILDKIVVTMERVQKLYDACDEWLTDPKKKDHRYTLTERADEIDIVYYTYSTNAKGSTIKTRHKDSLQELLDKAGKAPGCDDIHMVTTKKSDPRRLILDTALTVNKQLELLARVQGLISNDVVVNVDQDQLLVNLASIIDKTLSPYPEARELLVKALAEQGESLTQ